VFFYKGKRYRPTLLCTQAQIQLIDIRARIKAGTSDFAEEFPDYRFINDLEESSARRNASGRMLANGRPSASSHDRDS